MGVNLWGASPLYENPVTVVLVLPEGRFVDQGGQVIGIGLLEIGVIGIEPLNGPFQRVPGIEAAGPWGTVDVLLGFAGSFEEVGPVGA